MSTAFLIARRHMILSAVALALLSAGLGYGIAELGSMGRPSPTSEARRKILYWYDPMVPGQHFDRPGKSPFMDMELIPKYADAAGSAAPGIQISPDQVQRLGMRFAVARRGSLDDVIRVTGTVDFNQRDVAVVQSKAGGFVQRVYSRAPGDIVGAGAPLADILIPDWGGAQAEYLAVRRTGNAGLVRATRQRLLLLGMPSSLVAAVERSGRVQNVISITTPARGVIKTLGVRAGMTVSAGQTLAEINGLDTVWLNAALPEAMAAHARIGAPARAVFPAFPGEPFAGQVTAILPEAEGASRTLTVRIELRNRGLRLRPGMSATVELASGTREALLVPTETVIRTGRRTIVMLDKENGRFLPAEIETGREGGGQTEILAGLSEGEKVVASGQFLIDSEASLSGVATRPISGAPARSVRSANALVLLESAGRVEKIERDGVTISHQPVHAIGWPAMTMRFRLLDPSLMRGIAAGQQVRFAFDQPPQGPTLRRIAADTSR